MGLWFCSLDLFHDAAGANRWPYQLVLQVTSDHNVKNAREAARLAAAGAEVTDDGYVFGELCVSRDIGSYACKMKHRDCAPHALIAEPETHEVALGEEDDFLVMATDGLWDCMRDTEVIRVVRNALTSCRDPQVAAVALLEGARKMGATDNIAIIVALLHDRAITMARGKSVLTFLNRTPSAQLPLSSLGQASSMH